VIDHQIGELSIRTLDEADSASATVGRFRVARQQPIEKFGDPFDGIRVPINTDERVLWIQGFDEMPRMSAAAERSIDHCPTAIAWSIQSRPLDYFLEQDWDVNSGWGHEVLGAKK